MNPSVDIRRYKAVQVTTSSPGELLVALYDGLFRFLRAAETALAAGDRARGGENIDRAHAIIGEFAASLESVHAPELCDTLRGLYLFSMERLVEANIHQDATYVADVARVLSPLREAFTIVVRQGGAKATEERVSAHPLRREMGSAPTRAPSQKNCDRAL
jgi:flagellar secretion chaperone FliS